MMKNHIFLLLLPLILSSNSIFKDVSSEEFKILLKSENNFEDTYKNYLEFLENNDSDVNSLISLYAYSDIEKNLKIGAGLQGVPIVIKDNIDSVGLANTAGSLAMLDNLPSNDAHIVKKIERCWINYRWKSKFI
jgi:Asp-tRNA(Asn)/Glu-tRNA(Gln) amidotransferase A subunit family amidase